jgi:hypothetical protein
MKGFKTPVTTDRYITGITIWTTDILRKTRFTPDTTKTVTKMPGADVKWCGAEHTIRKSNRGHQVVL